VSISSKYAIFPNYFTAIFNFWKFQNTQIVAEPKQKVHAGHTKVPNWLESPKLMPLYARKVSVSWSSQRYSLGESWKWSPFHQNMRCFQTTLQQFSTSENFKTHPLWQNQNKRYMHFITRSHTDLSPLNWWLSTQGRSLYLEAPKDTLLGESWKWSPFLQNMRYFQTTLQQSSTSENFKNAHCGRTKTKGTRRSFKGHKLTWVPLTDASRHKEGLWILKLPKILSGGVLKVESFSSKYEMFPNFFTAIFNVWKFQNTPIVAEPKQKVQASHSKVPNWLESLKLMPLYARKVSVSWISQRYSLGKSCKWSPFHQNLTCFQITYSNFQLLKYEMFPNYFTTTN